MPSKYDEKLISRLEIIPKVCICILNPPKPTNIEVIINLSNSEMLEKTILFTPLVTSKIPEIMPLDKSNETVMKSNLEETVKRLETASQDRLSQIKNNVNSAFNIYKKEDVNFIQPVLTDFFQLLQCIR